MMFRMKLRSGEDVTFHEWNTLKADLMYEYGYDKECLYDVLEQYVKDADGNSVFEIRFDGTERQYF